MRIVAILAAYNEERFITGCLEHLFMHGVEAYLIDNCSTDQTVPIAQSYLGKGLIGIETFRRSSTKDWQALLERKEQLACQLDADWFMHADLDEIRLPPRPDSTLAEAFAKVEAGGYNAINFQEFTFVPTRESPDHDHPKFQTTMRHYYPFLSAPCHQLKAWKRQTEQVEFAWSGGHKVRFPGLRIYPESFPMRHYLFLSVPHLISKYVGVKFDPAAVRAGWHGWRARLRAEMIELPRQSELRTYFLDDELDQSSPYTKHITEAWAAPQQLSWRDRIFNIWRAG